MAGDALSILMEYIHNIEINQIGFNQYVDNYGPFNFNSIVISNVPHYAKWGGIT